MAKKAVAKKPAVKAEAKVAPKKHERKAKPSEAEMLERERRSAALYLVKRDGMDEDTARIVIESMAPEDVYELTVEANTAVIDAVVQAEAATAVAEPPVRQAEPVPDAPEHWDEPGGDGYVDFGTVDGLARNVDFPELVTECAQLQAERGRLEAVYKAKKAELWTTLLNAGLKPDVDKIKCAGIKLEPYVGTSSQLNKERLLELGVAADIVMKAYKRTKYNDVRIVVPRD